MMREYKRSLETEGYCHFKNVIPKPLLAGLVSDSDQAIEKDKRQGINRGNYFFMAHTRGDSLLELFKLSPLQKYIDEVLSETCIIHSFNALTLEPNVDVPIQGAVHRDSPRFCRPYLLSLQVLYMLDDFTKENGATYVLPGSHLKEAKPIDSEFYNSAIQLEGKAGDAIIFDAMLWHAAGTNQTNSARRAMTAVYTRSFMKQQIDLTKATDPAIISELDNDKLRLLGFDARVPTSLNEFNLPVEKRLYKANQG